MKEKLYILWTNADEITSEKMVLMYATNAMKNNWWDEITVIVWGSSNKLIEESDLIKEKIKKAMSFGVNFSACKACADQLNTSSILEELGVELKYWGVGLTAILKDNEKIITV